MLRMVANKVVKKHINRWDPISLLAGGAPSDEYDSEIKHVVDAVLNSNDQIAVAEAIKNIFDRMFDTNLQFDDCLHVAKNIWEELYGL